MKLTECDGAGIQQAAQALRDGKLVVFPTETVYGLGANAHDADAVAKVYAAKKRPTDNPLIVHCADVAAVRLLVNTWPPEAEALAAKFWPGPLTLVLPRRHGATDAVAGGLDTIAVRVPRHPAAQALLRAVGVPIAAPSANQSGRPSPTRARDALEDLGDAAAVYLDGGDAHVGLESTVVMLTGPRPVLLRQGGIPREAIEAILGPIELVQEDGAGPVPSPGMKYRHYAPNAQLRLATRDEVRELWDQQGGAGNTGFIVSAECHIWGPHVRVPGSSHDPEAWAHFLFAMMRDLDHAGCTHIVVEGIPEDGVGAAVMDRLRRAAAGSVTTGGSHAFPGSASPSG